MGMKLSPELVQEILSRPDTVVRQCGAIVDGKGEREPEPKSPKMVEASVTASDGRVVIVIPAVTSSEANESKWTRKMRRKLSAKEATRQTLGPHLDCLVPLAEAYHSGKMLKVVFTRLGGRRLDACNLPSSCKSVEDTIAGALLANDGDARWSPRWQQELGGAVGVRVEIEVVA